MNERIKELRKALNLSQEKFGERLGIKKNTVSQLENGINNVTDTTLKLICREFGVNASWLISGDGEMFANKGDEDVLARIDYILTGEDSLAKDTFRAFAALSEEEWNLVGSIIAKLEKNKDPR